MKKDKIADLVEFIFSGGRMSGHKFIKGVDHMRKDMTKFWVLLYASHFIH